MLLRWSHLKGLRTWIYEKTSYDWCRWSWQSDRRYAVKMNKWQEIEFFDDDTMINLSMGFKVIGKLNKALSLIGEYDIFMAIENNKIRENIYIQIKAAAATIPTLIHPNSYNWYGS